MRLMSKGEYVIVPKGTKFTGSGKLGLMFYYKTNNQNGTQQNERPIYSDDNRQCQ